MKNRRKRTDRILGAIIVACCIVLALLLWDVVRGANLGTRVELQTQLYGQLETTSSDNFWDTALVNQIVDESINDVQLFMQCARAEDTIALTAHTLRYDAPSEIAQEGVLFAFFQKGGSSQPRRVRPIRYMIPDDFGRESYSRPEEFTIVNNTLLINATPDGSDTLYVWYYKITPYMDYDSSTVNMPQQWRSLAMDLAYAKCKKIRGFDNFYLTEIQRIYGLMRELRERFPKSEPTSTQQVPTNIYGRGWDLDEDSLKHWLDDVVYP